MRIRTGFTGTRYNSKWLLGRPTLSPFLSKLNEKGCFFSAFYFKNMTILKDTIIEQLVNRIRDLPILSGESKVIERVKNLPPEDIADIVEELNDRQKVKLLLVLADDIAAQVVNSLEDEKRYDLLRLLPKEKTLAIIRALSTHELADIGSSLKEDERKEFLRLIPKKQKAEVRDLLGYKKDSAGSLMSTDYIRVSTDDTVSAVLRRVRKAITKTQGLHYFYAVDQNNKFVGTVSLRTLIASPGKTKISEIMSKRVIYVYADTDQEEAAQLMKKYNFLALPVVSSKRELLGIILSDDLLDILEEEATEDIYRQVGLNVEESPLSPLTSSLKRRVPWLIANLLTAFLAVLTVTFFEGTIVKVAILAAFMPIIAGHGGNTGTQTTTIMVRGLALGEITPADAFRVASKGIGFGMIYGILAGIITALLAFILSDNLWLSLVVFTAMLGNVIIAAVVGSIIPLAMKAIKVDPALASAVWLTTFTDAVGFLILLGLGTAFINRLV